MEKKIILEMLTNKDIQVSINDTVEFVIKKDNRIVKAREIYDLFNYSRGDNYTVKVINPNNFDPSVLDFFFKLLEEIADTLNNISSNKEDKETVEDYNGTNDDVFQSVKI